MQGTYEYIQIDTDFIFHFSIRIDNAADKMHKPLHWP